jgi:hypothetical protein
MPTVGKKKFPYTPSGLKAAKMAKKNKLKKTKTKTKPTKKR